MPNYRSCTASPTKLRFSLGSHWIPHGPQLFIVPAKNGSTSIASYFHPGSGRVSVPPSVMDIYHYKTFIIREPIARLMSAHRHLYQNIPYRRLVDSILSADGDRIDWPLRPQVDFLMGHAPTRTVSILEISQENPGFPQLNVTSGNPTPLSDYRRDDLLQLYAEDWQYWSDYLTSTL